MPSYTKWNKYKVMRKDDKLKTYLPETTWFQRDSLAKAAKAYSEFILKPSGAAGGHGVMMVRRKGKGFEVQSGRTVRGASDFEALYDRVKGSITRGFIIQRRIDLAQIAGRLIDLRVMVQRPKKDLSNWHVTGKLAKVGGKGFIITNTALSGGYVLPLEAALRRSNIPRGRLAAIPGELDRIALRTVRTLHPQYRYIHSVGIDIGVDEQGRVWIIEANFAPSRALFNKLKDKTMYRRILTY